MPYPKFKITHQKFVVSMTQNIFYSREVHKLQIFLWNKQQLWYKNRIKYTINTYYMQLKRKPSNEWKYVI